MREEAERAEPVVDRDDDDAVRRELGAVVVEGAVLGEPAAVDPHEHRPPRVVAQRRGGDVQVQAILGLGTRRLEQAGLLRAARRVVGRVANPAPPGWALRRAPAQLAGRRSGVGQPAERVAAGDGHTADRAVAGEHDRSSTPGRSERRCRSEPAAPNAEGVSATSAVHVAASSASRERDGYMCVSSFASGWPHAKVTRPPRKSRPRDPWSTRG